MEVRSRAGERDMAELYSIVSRELLDLRVEEIGKRLDDWFDHTQGAICMGLVEKNIER